MTIHEAKQRFGEKEPSEEDAGLKFWADLKAAGFTAIREADKNSLTAPKEQYTRPDPLGIAPVWPEGWCELRDGRTAFRSYYGGIYAEA